MLTARCAPHTRVCRLPPHDPSVLLASPSQTRGLLPQVVNMLALASLAASAPLRKDALLTEPAPLTESQSDWDVLTEQELGSVLDQPEEPESLTATMAKSSCPSNVKGVLYNHIMKTGGTAANYMFRAVLSNEGEPKYQWDDRGMSWNELNQGANESMPRYVYEYGMLKDHGGNLMPISSADGHKYFVIGMVRPPCDYLLSQWVEQSNEANAKPTPGWAKSAKKDPANWYGDGHHDSPPYSSEVDKGKFRDFVGLTINETNKVGPSKATLEESPLMSVGARVRGYDKAEDGGYLHCIMYTHTIVNDFKKCIRQYESCGRAPGFTHRPTGPT